MFLWQLPEWPRLYWDAERLLVPLGQARHKQGLLLGSLAGLGFDLRLEAQVVAVTDEVMKTSAIEGEMLDLEGVRSSVARQLGVENAAAFPRADPKTEGVVQMTLDATARYASPLTDARLFSWHAALFPTGYSGLHRIRTGAWRDDAEGPMQVVSGTVGRPRVHFEAPPAAKVAKEMRRFLKWFNAPGKEDGLVRVGLAHFWFVTVHPFDDGNGRIARAVADMALAQLEKSSQRFYSVSSQIQRERRTYYDVLEQTQKGPLDVTRWLLWFLGCYERCLDAAQKTCADVLERADFWKRLSHESFSERQRKVLHRLLRGFEGRLTARKWAALGKCSVDSAQRDLTELTQRGVLIKNPGGSKNTSYSLRQVKD